MKKNNKWLVYAALIVAALAIYSAKDDLPLFAVSWGGESSECNKYYLCSDLTKADCDSRKASWSSQGYTCTLESSASEAYQFRWLLCCVESGVTPSGCVERSKTKCYDNDLYWYDSCGVRGALAQDCSSGCASDTECKAASSTTPSSNGDVAELEEDKPKTDYTKYALIVGLGLAVVFAIMMMNKKQQGY